MNAPFSNEGIHWIADNSVTSANIIRSASRRPTELKGVYQNENNRPDDPGNDDHGPASHDERRGYR